MARVGDPNLTAVVRRRRVGALGRFNCAKQARLPARGNSDDRQRSLLRVGHVDVPEDRVVSDQVRALSNLESAKDPSVMGHVNHGDAPSAGADEKPRFGFVERETAGRTFGAVLPFRHDSVRGDIDRNSDLLVLAVRVDPRPNRVYRKRLRPSPARHLHDGSPGEPDFAAVRKCQDFDLALLGGVPQSPKPRGWRERISQCPAPFRGSRKRRPCAAWGQSRLRQSGCGQSRIRNRRQRPRRWSCPAKRRRIRETRSQDRSSTRGPFEPLGL